MIVLDTNVLSELAKQRPDENVRRWLNRQQPAEIFVTAIARAEMLSGIALMPEGKRRAGMWAATERVFAEQFPDKVLAFDGDAATAYAEIVAARKRRGRPVSGFDALIAAIARAHKAAVATRDVGGFEHAGIAIINPWET